MSLNESIVEDAALESFGVLDYALSCALHRVPGERSRTKCDVRFRLDSSVLK